MSTIPLDLRHASAAALVAAAVDALRATAANVVTVPLSGALLDRAVAGGRERLRRVSLTSWEHPADRTAWFGLGVAARAGGGRGADRAEAASFLDWLRAGSARDDTLARARVAFGFEFDPACERRDPNWNGFGGWQAILPRLLVVNEAGEWHASLVIVRSPHLNSAELTAWLESALLRTRERPLPPRRTAFPPGDAADWERAVAEAVAEIRAGRYQKVVLARARQAGADSGPGDVLDRLAERYPQCFVFRFDAADHVFLGASPERLVSLSDGIVRADSLAGSRPRGGTAECDAALGAELLRDHKEREEHAFVVDAIRAALEPACSALRARAEPALMRLANIQHLHTPIEGDALPGITVLDLATRMHPTPAIGGWPAAESLNAIRRLEQIDRGWYGGPIGWADLNGDGEFAVALRSALVGAGSATLYAGCGIVAESDPERELAETELKFRPLLEALR